MKTLSSREMQKNFGIVVGLVGAGETLCVTKHGRKAFYIVPENEDTAEMMRKIAGRRLVKNLHSMKSSEEAKALAADDITQLIHDCFA